MQKREKILAAVVASLLVLLACYNLLGRVTSAFSSRQTQIDTLKATIREKQGLERRGQQAALQLAEWEHRSLPSNQTMATTLYQKWLIEAADRVKLTNSNIDAGRGQNHRNIYQTLPFTVQARGSLEQVVAFLHEFYSANHLHQLRSVSLKPVSNSKDLDINLAIEALVLPGADRRNELNDERSTRLALASLEPYKQAITGRNLFAQYVPPAPRPIVSAPRYEAPRPSFDPAKFAVLTAILEVGDGPQAWVSVKTSGELIRLREGDKVSVGQFEGIVARINVSDIEIEAQGKRRQLALGKSLPQAVEMPSTEPAASEPATSESSTTPPLANEPAASEPAATEPAASEPAASEPAATKPESGEPAASEAALSESTPIASPTAGQ